MSYHRNSQQSGDVAVIGGGLGGLVAASYLVRAGHSVTIFDSRKRLGGRATTDERRGFLFNQGPHALYLGGEASAVLSDLGVKPQGGRPGANSTILRGGEIHLGPAKATTLLRTRGLTMREKIDVARVFAQVPKIDARQHRGETVNQWLDQLVNTDGARDLVAALARLTTYTDQPDLLSADIAIGQIRMGLGPGVLYLDGGWQQLVDTITRSLQANNNVEFRLGERLTELPDAQAVVVATGDPASTGNLIGKRFVGEQTGSDHAESRLPRSGHVDPGHPGLGPSARAACLDLGTSSKPQHDLIIGIDEPFFLSNHSAGAKLAPDKMWHVAAVQYLSQGDRGDRESLEAFAARGWGSADKLEQATIESRYLHNMVSVSAIPVATGGGAAGRPGVSESGYDNVFIVGDWVGPTGYLADASLASAKAAAAAVSRHLDSALVA